MKFIHEKFLGEKRLGEIIGRSYNKTAGEYVKLTGYQLKLQVFNVRKINKKFCIFNFL